LVVASWKEAVSFGTMTEGPRLNADLMFEDVFKEMPEHLQKQAGLDARGAQVMASMNMIQALNSAMDIMLKKDPSVVLMGEDVGYFGGVFRATEGLQRKYGEQRVIDTPIAEGGIVAAAIGMSVNGLRPVAEIQFADYIYPGFDQIASELARLRYRSAGEFHAPVTIRTPCGGGIRGGQTHSQKSGRDFYPCLRPQGGDAVESLRRQGAVESPPSRTMIR